MTYHPAYADALRYFKSRSRRQASSPEAVIADLHQALPPRYAKQAEEIYRCAHGRGTS